MAELLSLNLAYVLLVIAAFTTQLTRLRVALVLGALAFIAYGIVEQVWSIVVWNILIGGLHAFRVARSLVAERAIVLTDYETATRDSLFPGLGDFDFHHLWCLGSVVRYDEEAMITRGSQPHTVSVLLEGVVEIRRDGEAFRYLKPGALIGEMSFVSGMPSAVDVAARGPVTVHQFDQRQLQALAVVSPAGARAFDALVQRDLAVKARV